jgi:hypothetical protein
MRQTVTALETEPRSELDLTRIRCKRDALEIRSIERVDYCSVHPAVVHAAFVEFSRFSASAISTKR